MGTNEGFETLMRSLNLAYRATGQRIGDEVLYEVVVPKDWHRPDTTPPSDVQAKGECEANLLGKRGEQPAWK